MASVGQQACHFAQLVVESHRGGAVRLDRLAQWIGDLVP
jgi:hypothetical protein